MVEAKKGFKAVAKYQQISPTKLRRVARLLRRKPYTVAVATLEALPQRGAGMLLKTLKSAAANAIVQDRNLFEDRLVVKTVQIDEGPRFKKGWLRGRGRHDILLKRRSHISVILGDMLDRDTGVGSGTES